jgi:superfamily II RNA helicase
MSSNNLVEIYNDNENKENIEIFDDDILYKFKYNLDNFQKVGVNGIINNKNLLISCPTGSGKTFFADYGILHTIRIKKKKCIYTSPIKSLSNQKYNEFIQLLGDDKNVGIITGDIKKNVDADCIIMTTEILRNILYKNNIDCLINIDDIGTVIFDEIHYINDKDRGKIWEECLVLLNPSINLIMLSATIDEPENFCKWIYNIKKTPILLIKKNDRVVPLKHYFWKSYLINNDKSKDEYKWELLEILDEKNNFKNYDIMRKNYKVHDINKLMDKLIDFLIDKSFLPCLFFKFSRKKCELYCKMVRKNLLSYEEISEISNLFDFYMKDYKKTYETLPQYIDVYNQILKGCVYHHSGLLSVLKEIIEILYGKGLIKIIFATETFSIGVNYPTKTVIFTELEKYDDNGTRNLKFNKYTQMSGRAGRRGIDFFGNIIILPTMDLLSELSLRTMMNGKPSKFESKFKLTYQFVLKSICDNFDINDFLEDTLIMDENKKKIFLNSIEKENIEIKLSKIKNSIKEDDIIIFKNYDKINSKLNDTFFVLKKKEREKLEKEKKNIETNSIFINLYENYKSIKEYENQLENINYNIWYCENNLKNNINTMKELLKNELYIDNFDKITSKGLIAKEMNECNEILFTEMIYQGLLDNLEFPEIIAVLSSFINEKDQNGEERYISDLYISNNVKDVLKELMKIAESYINLEEKYKIYINSDYKLYLDFIEPSYIWAKGGSIEDVYQHTTIYDGNFVKAIMRINNICDNLMSVCLNLEKFNLCKKLEGYSQILIRDITTINSLYVK